MLDTALQEMTAHAQQRNDWHSKDNIKAQVIVTLRMVISGSTQGRRVEGLTWSLNHANAEEVQCINKFVSQHRKELILKVQ